MGGHGRGKGAAIMRPVFRLADRIFFGVPFGVPTFNTLLVRRRGTMMVEGTDMSMAEKDRTKLTEEGALKGLGKIVGKHVLGGTVHNVDVAPLAVVGNKEITDVDVSGALATGGLAVALHLDGALVVLVKNSGVNGVALCFHEHLAITAQRVRIQPDGSANSVLRAPHNVTVIGRHVVRASSPATAGRGL